VFALFVESDQQNKIRPSPHSAIKCARIGQALSLAKQAQKAKKNGKKKTTHAKQDKKHTPVLYKCSALGTTVQIL
jgi:hypothetical protein